MNTQSEQNQTESKTKASELEILRIDRAFYLSIIGLILAVFLVVVLLFSGWKAAADITSVVGLFTSVLGTLVGAFFGLQVGSAGKEKAENRADKADKRADNAQKKSETLLGLADPSTITKAREIYPDLFK